MKKWTLVFCLFIFCSAVYAQQKHALVIGNGNYTDWGRLRNPVNDADDMAAALTGLGFNVDKVLDGDLDRMESAVMRLKDRLSVSKSAYGFFFYAGHGVQSNGVNYLIPAGANIPSENSLRERSVSVQWLLDELNDASNELNVVVLDACRDNPFSWRRSGSRGLTVVGNQPADSIVVYATSAGSIAQDGTGRNGLFTSRLLNNLKTPGLEVTEIFRRTGQEVQVASERKQIPEVYNKFFGNAYFSRPVVAQTTPQPAPAPQPTSISANMIRINGGTFQMGSPANEVGRESNEVQHSVTVSSFYMGKYLVTQKEYREVMGTNPSDFNGDNRPVDSVSWFDAVNYCNRLSQREGLTPAYTINGENVTWNQNANGYRLPTEAEWEYACRAGTTMPFSTGNNITTNQANYDGRYPYNNNATGIYRQSPTPVGSFAPNPWGLYDMHGNVREWCWDWFRDYSGGAQTDPRGAEVSGPPFRVMRGGSWINHSKELRSAYRGFAWDKEYNNFFGFRLVRS